MSNRIRTYFCNIPNVGDQLTALILKELWGMEAVHSKPPFCDMVGIGSILESICFMPRKDSNYQFRTQVKSILSSVNPCYVWTSGFMSWNNELPIKFYRKNIVFNAVRGKLTKEIIEGIHANSLSDTILADGALLSSILLKSLQKKHQISIIPHYADFDAQSIHKLIANYKNPNIIDVRKEPIDVIKEIAESEVILSSSLHGLIIADSFNIPNQHIIVRPDSPSSQLFKFKDYYSSYDLPYDPIDIQDNCTYPSINDIIDRYKIDRSAVVEKQNQLIQRFPFQ